MSLFLLLPSARWLQGAGGKEGSGGGNLLSARKEFSILSKAPCEHKFRAAAVANNKQQAANSKRQTATKGHSQYVKSSIRSPLCPLSKPLLRGGFRYQGRD